MRIHIAFCCALVLLGCTTKDDSLKRSRPQVLRDVEGYAIASCLFFQQEPYLKEQGDAWASAIVQRSKGDIKHLTELAAKIKGILKVTPMAVVRIEDGASAKTKTTPILFCNEFMDEPSVRAAIQQAATSLATDYENPE